VRWLSCTRVPPTSTGTSTTTPASNVPIRGCKSGTGGMNLPASRIARYAVGAALTASADGKNPPVGCHRRPMICLPRFICTVGPSGRPGRIGKRFLRLIRMIRGMADGDPEIMAIWREP